MPNTRDARERASEMLGCIVVSRDMMDRLPMELVRFVRAQIFQKTMLTERLYPLFLNRPSPQTVAAEIDRGAWVVPCPFCKGQEYTDPAEPLFICCSCWNQDTGGRPLRVVFPDNALEVEMALLERPMAKHRRWKPGMSAEAMAEDYERVKVEGTPTNQATGDLITATIWNGAVGPSGDVGFLWDSHDHSGDAGDGATLANKAILGAGIYALGQMQGAEANLLRVEYKHSSNTVIVTNSSVNISISNWDNPFATLLESFITVRYISGDLDGLIGCIQTVQAANGINTAQVRRSGGTADMTIAVAFLAIGY